MCALEWSAGWQAHSWHTAPRVDYHVWIYSILHIGIYIKLLVWITCVDYCSTGLNGRVQCRDRLHTDRPQHQIWNDSYQINTWLREVCVLLVGFFLLIKWTSIRYLRTFFVAAISQAWPCLKVSLISPTPERNGARADASIQQLYIVYIVVFIISISWMFISRYRYNSDISARPSAQVSICVNSVRVLIHMLLMCILQQNRNKAFAQTSTIKWFF